jgi:predicted RNA-binding Zn-ribbon protein involved in translation (DUF1610 family)
MTDLLGSCTPHPDTPRMHSADAAAASETRITYEANVDCPHCGETFMASWSSARDQQATTCPRCGHGFLSAFPGFILTEPAVIR